MVFIAWSWWPLDPNQIQNVLLGSGWGVLIVKHFWQKRELRRERRRARRERAVDRIIGHLDRYGQLWQLYRLLARSEHRLVRDAGTSREDAVQHAVERRDFAPDPRLAAAFERLHGSDIESAIGMKLVEIYTASAEVLDLIDTLDRSGSLRREFTEMHDKCTRALEFWMETQDFEAFVEDLREANAMRRRMRLRLEGYVR